jgi:hypothetical protein
MWQHSPGVGDDVGRVVVGYHNVLVATLGADRETPSVICVESSEWEFAQVPGFVPVVAAWIGHVDGIGPCGL